MDEMYVYIKLKQEDTPTRLNEMRGAKTKSVVRSSKEERAVHQCCPNHSSTTPECCTPSDHVPDNTSPASNPNTIILINSTLHSKKNLLNNINII